MSQTDSFIDEVTEEVRRDRLYATFRRWAWLGVLLVVVVVGGASWNEWRQAQARAAAEEKAVALEAALAGDGIAPGPLGALIAGEGALATDAEAPALYRDLAALRQAADLPADEARALLSAIAQPGAPYRALAEERLAYLDAAEGRTDAALARLEALQADQAAPAALRGRAAQAILALGGAG